MVSFLLYKIQNVHHQQGPLSFPFPTMSVYTDQFCWHSCNYEAKAWLLSAIFDVLHIMCYVINSASEDGRNKNKYGSGFDLENPLQITATATTWRIRVWLHSYFSPAGELETKCCKAYFWKSTSCKQPEDLLSCWIMLWNPSFRMLLDHTRCSEVCSSRMGTVTCVWCILQISFQTWMVVAVYSHLTDMNLYQNVRRTAIMSYYPGLLFQSLNF